MRRLLGRPLAVAQDGTEGDEVLFDEAFQKKLEYLAIVSRRVFQGRTRAERRSKKTGSGIEFADHRHYSPGDDFRFLDWNVYSRLGRLLVRLFEEEEDLSIYVLLDCSASMRFGAPPKLSYAKKLAAALAYIGLTHLDRVALVGLSDRVTGRLPPTRGRNRIFAVFRFLQGLHASGTTDLGAATRAFVAQHKRRGVVILISDLYDAQGFERGINNLRYAKFEPAVIHLVDPEEARPRLRGDVRIVDAESGVERDVTLTDGLVARYAARHAAYRARIARFCRDKQVPLFELDTHVPFEDATLRLLRERGLVL